MYFIRHMFFANLFCRKASLDGVGKQVCQVTLHTTGRRGRHQVRKVAYVHTAMCRRRPLLLEVSGPDPSQWPLLVATSVKFQGPPLPMTFLTDIARIKSIMSHAM
jgi:hypothetical protein